MRVVKYVAVFAMLFAWVGCPYTEGCEAGSAPIGDGDCDGSNCQTSGTSGTSGNTPQIPLGPIEPNCKGLEAKCNGESCCTASNIPGGTFNRLNDPALPATVSDFRLDVYEVTVGRFRAFVNAGMGIKSKAPAKGAGKNPNDPDDEGWDEEWNAILNDDKESLVASIMCDDKFYPAYDPNPGKNDSVPMNCVNWPEAQAFCIWDGGRLPTETEWNYAAAGGDEQRILPNGDTTASKDMISFGCYSGGSEEATKAEDPSAPECKFSDYLPVGSKKDGRGRWGQQDMSGSDFERMYDWLVPKAAMPNPCNNCAVHKDPGTKDNPGGRVFRGGGLNWPKTYQLTTSRDDNFNFEFMTDRTNTVGFRCARPTTK